jgi:arylalkylamine N-acetyltransferase
MGLMDLIDSKYDTFVQFPEIDAFVDGKILAVDPECRGMGIAGHLTSKTIEYMKANNLEIFQMLCSSHFSARVCEKLGFSEIFSLKFTEYVDDKNCQILNPEKPHVAARIFVQRITI